MISQVYAEKVLQDVGGMDVLPTSEGAFEFYFTARPAFTGTVCGFDAFGDAERLYLRFDVPQLTRELAKEGLTIEGGAFVCTADEQFVGLVRAARVLVDQLPEYDPDSEFDPELNETESEGKAKQRRGQVIYRERLEALWGGRCAVTGIGVRSVLRASHAKPWAECRAGAERLNPYNGLLLCANLDALFDAFLITFSDEGELVVSSSIPEGERGRLGIAGVIRIELKPEHQPFMDWHRARFWKRERGAKIS